MNYLKKLYFLIIVLGLALSPACSKLPSQEERQVSEKELVEKEPDKKIDSSDNKKTSEKEDKNALGFLSSVLIDQELVLVRTEGLVESDLGPVLKVFIKNKSDKNLSLQLLDSSLNGIMINPDFYCQLDGKEESYGEILFPKEELEYLSIEAIKDVEFKIFISDNYQEEVLLASDPIYLENPEEKDYVQDFDRSGRLVLDQENLKIYLKIIPDQDMPLENDFVFYIENQSPRDITVHIEDFSLNDLELDPVLSTDILAGKKSIANLIFFEDDLADKNLDFIDKLEFSFQVLDLVSWEPVFQSEKISIEVN